MDERKSQSVNHKIRCKAGGVVEITDLTRAMAIKLQCTECMGWGEADPMECSDLLCPLYPFRGYSRAGYTTVKAIRSPEVMKKTSDALRNWRENRKGS